MTKANKRLGLPKWPRLRLNEKTGECFIQEKHFTYRRICMGAFLQNVLVTVGFIGPFLFTFRDAARASEGWNEGIALVGGLVIAFCLVLPAALLPTAKILTWLFFRKKTKIHFSGDMISINGKRFSITSEYPIQFRASRPYLDEEKHARLQRRVYSRKKSGLNGLKLKFRRVEMIRGSAIEPVAVIADQNRAEQFAVVLQAGLMWNRQLSSIKGGREEPSVSKTKASKSPVSVSRVDDDLPE